MTGSSYQAKVVNVNNNFQPSCNYLSFALAMAQWSDDSVILFDEDRDIIYFNNKLGTLTSATKFDFKSLETSCRFFRSTYIDGDKIYNAVFQCYTDLKPAFFTATKQNGDLIGFKIIPVVDNITLRGVILKGKFHGRTEIRSGQGKCIQQGARYERQ